MASLGPYAICTLMQTHNLASIILLSFLHARRSTCHRANSVKAMKAEKRKTELQIVSYHVHVYFGPLIMKIRTTASTDPTCSSFVGHVLYIIVKLCGVKFTSYA